MTEETEVDPTQFFMKVELYGHETLASLGVKGPDDMLTREWKLGDTFTLSVVGITRKGVVEGVQVR